MSALEQKIIEKIRQMDEAQQQKILEYIQDVEEKEPFEFDEWTRQVDQFQAELKIKYGEEHVFGTLDLLDELREEASWPRIS